VLCLKKLRIYSEKVALYAIVVVSLCVYLRFLAFCGGLVGRVLISCPILICFYDWSLCFMVLFAGNGLRVMLMYRRLAL
jgi:hypothetical protein